MMNMVPLPRRGVAWLPLVILVSCLYLAFSVSFLPSFASALRTNNKPTDSTVESSVAFTNEEPEDKEYEKDVPIKPHAFGAEGATAAEGEYSASEREQGEPEEAETSRQETPQQPGEAAAAAESASEAAAATAAESAAESKAEGPPSGASTSEQQQKQQQQQQQPGGAGAPSGAPAAAAGAEGVHSHLKEVSVVKKEELMTPIMKEHIEAEGPSRGLGRDAINERLAALGAPFKVGKSHFTVEFDGGLRLSSSDFERLASSPSGILYRGVSEEPSVLSEKDIFLAVDLDDPSLGTDVRLIQLTVKPRACSVKAENACKIQWLIRQPSPAALPHRILLLGFSSPTGSPFEFDELLKSIQKKPMDLDLRRISLSRFFETHAKFFNDESGNFAAAPSWHDFALVSHAPGEGNEPQLGAPLLELPANATEEQKAAAIRISRESNEEIDGISTPEHGGESPGAGGKVGASTIFKYVLASLLLIGLIVGVAVTVCPCAKAS